MTLPELFFRTAEGSDLQEIVRLLADDALGSKRERNEVPLPRSYQQAFDAISQDPNNELVVAVTVQSEVVGVLQITFTPYITHQGGWRATIEGVRVSNKHRNSGAGRRMFEWAIGRARARGCHLVQLTSDTQRPDAIRFYEGLGFVASHEGMKLKISADGAA